MIINSITQVFWQSWEFSHRLFALCRLVPNPTPCVTPLLHTLHRHSDCYLCNCKSLKNDSPLKTHWLVIVIFFYRLRALHIIHPYVANDPWNTHVGLIFSSCTMVILKFWMLLLRESHHYVIIIAREKWSATTSSPLTGLIFFYITQNISQGGVHSCSFVLHFKESNTLSLYTTH